MPGLRQMRPANLNCDASQYRSISKIEPEGNSSIRERNGTSAAAAAFSSVRDGHDHRVRVGAGVRRGAGSRNVTVDVDRLRRSVAGAEKAAVRGRAGCAAGGRGPGIGMGRISKEIVADEISGVRHPPLAAGRVCSIIHGDGVGAAIGAGDRDCCAAGLQGGRKRCSGDAPEIECCSVDCAGCGNGDLHGQIRGRRAGLGGALTTGCQGYEEHDR
ncbi:hypothetical protein chiPu_0031031, partial [Chiloscyllium punctatum]|nr:hypothetical protein [Chiloscyllium punctatum]